MRHRVGVAGAGLVLALASAPLIMPGAARAAGACDWPMFGQNPSRSAASPCDGMNQAINQANVSTLHPVWFFPTPDNSAITATPTVVDGMVYAGDSTGDFFAIQPGTGVASAKWTFNIKSAQAMSGTNCKPDGHNPSFGEITSSAAVADGLVVFGGGGSVYALNADSGTCAWSQDVDPYHPTGPMSVESSPAIVDLAGQSDPVVIVGSDNNEDSSSTDTAPGGVQAFDLLNGHLLWKFEPYGEKTFVGPAWPSASSTPPDGVNNGCSDVWSSPAVDPAHDLVVFGQGNCPGNNAGPDAGQVDGIMAIHASTGQPAWDFSEPTNAYTGPQFPDNGDTDFGSSPIITGDRRVVEGGKSGYVYVLDEASGTEIRGAQAAQPGELGVGPGAFGGFIGSAALGAASPPAGSPSPETFFAATAIVTPFDGNGAPVIASGGAAGVDTTMACGVQTGATPDPGCLTRSVSLHAVDTVTGKVLWQAPISLPSYSAVTYSNGVVFSPSTTGFSLHAYDADTGTQLWSYPLGATVASGAAVAGRSLYVGTGITEGASVPGANGVWAFTTAA